MWRITNGIIKTMIRENRFLNGSQDDPKKQKSTMILGNIIVRLLINIQSQRTHISLNLGSISPRIISQKNNWTTKGMLRKNSTYVSASLESKRLFDRRATPTKTPIIVQNRILIRTTRTALEIPTA